MDCTITVQECADESEADESEVLVSLLSVALLLFEVFFHPNEIASSAASPNKAERCINFFGMHPTFTQVPPKPHVVP